MASVSSLDKDLRNLRLGKYTPQAVSEVRRWIEDVLGEPLVPGDLLDALKDGTALCKYDAMFRPTYFIAYHANADCSDLSTLQPAHLVSGSKTQQCPSSKWRTSPTSSALANPLLSISNPMTSSRP